MVMIIKMVQLLQDEVSQTPYQALPFNPTRDFWPQALSGSIPTCRTLDWSTLLSRLWKIYSSMSAIATSLILSKRLVFIVNC